MSGRRSWYSLVIGLVLAVGLSSCGSSNPPSGISGDFWEVHDTPSDDAQPGDIHTLEERDDAPLGSRGWNMVYVSEIESGTKTYVSGEVYVPDDSDAVARDVVLWHHPTTGLPDECAPSRSEISETRMPELTQLLNDGHIVIASDYPGQGLPGPVYYMVGEANARASLDALKSLEHLPGIRPSGKFVQYGFSQGGQTAMHAEAIAADYAPDFELVGTSLMAPAVRVQGLMANAMQHEELTGFALAMLTGVQTAYPDLRFENFLTDEAIETLPEVNESCGSMWEAGTSIEQPYTESAMQEADDWAIAMAEIDNFAPTGKTPFIISHGTDDKIVPPELARREAAILCDAGAQVEYHEFDGLQHGAVVPGAVEGFPDWAQARFDDEVLLKDDCS